MFPVDPSAWLGLAGVAVGGVLALATSVLQEGRRQRHEERSLERQQSHERIIRFENRRFNAYVDLISSANRVYAACSRRPVDQRSSPDEVRAAQELFLAALSPAFLLTTSERSHQLIAALARTIKELAEAIIAADAAGVSQLLAAHRDAVKSLEVAVREELSISGSFD
jgi:hypothetical protein